MCGSEYFNGRLVNKKDRIKIHGHDRSPKKGTCQVFKFFLQIDSHFFQSAKVISSDEQYNCYNISFDKDFTPAHYSLKAAVTKNNQIQYLYKTLYICQTKPHSATMPRTLHL